MSDRLSAAALTLRPAHSSARDVLIERLIANRDCGSPGAAGLDSGAIWSKDGIGRKSFLPACTAPVNGAKTRITGWNRELFRLNRLRRHQGSGSSSTDVDSVGLKLSRGCAEQLTSNKEIPQSRALFVASALHQRAAGTACSAHREWAGALTALRRRCCGVASRVTVSGTVNKTST